METPEDDYGEFNSVTEGTGVYEYHEYQEYGEEYQASGDEYKSHPKGAGDGELSEYNQYEDAWADAWAGGVKTDDIAHAEEYVEEAAKRSDIGHDEDHGHAESKSHNAESRPERNQTPSPSDQRQMAPRKGANSKSALSPSKSPVKFFKPKGNPVERLRSCAEVQKAMTMYIDNLSVQEESCREIQRLCGADEEVHPAFDGTVGGKVAHCLTHEMSLAADEAVRLHLPGEIFTALTRFWNETTFCAHAFAALRVLAGGGRAKDIGVAAESQRQLRQLGTGFDAFVGAMDGNTRDERCMHNACEAIARLAEERPANRDFMVRRGCIQAIVNALDMLPTSVVVVVAAARALRHLSAGRSSLAPDHYTAQLMRVAHAYPSLIAGLTMTRESDPPLGFRAGFRAIAQIARDKKNRIALGNSGGVGLLVSGMDVVLAKHDLEAQIEGLRAVQTMVVSCEKNRKAFLMKGGAGCVIRSMSAWSLHSITCTFEACRAFCSVIGMRAGRQFGGKEADEADEVTVRYAMKIEEDDDGIYVVDKVSGDLVSKAELERRNKREQNLDNKEGTGIAAVDYHTVVAFLRVLVPALEDCIVSEKVQADGLRVLAGITGSEDYRYPPLACDLEAARITRDGMSQHM